MPVYNEAEVQIGEKSVFHGHGIQLWGPEDSKADDVKSVLVPGAYWMQGAVVEVEGRQCTFDPETVTWDCGEEHVASVKGVMIDLCYAMGATSTHCDLLTNAQDCNLINTCNWKGGACVYKLTKENERELIQKEATVVSEEPKTFDRAQ